MVARPTSSTVSSGAPETSIVYYSSGGHNHNGINSTLIDTSKYSIFDFNPSVGVGSDTNRLNSQTTNFNSFKNFVISTVNDAFISPQGVAIKANTITADAIVTNTITAEQLSAELILVNNLIKSNNYVSGSSGWQIASDGSAEFSNVTIRGVVISNSGTIGGWNIDSSGIYKTVGSYTSRFNSVDSSIYQYGTFEDLLSYNISTPGTLQVYASSRTFDLTSITGGSINTKEINLNGQLNSKTVRANTVADDAIYITGGGITVGNTFTLRAVTGLRLTGSSTTARVTTGDQPGYDAFARPSSTRALKENIKDIDDGLSVLLDLRPRIYNYKVDAFSPVDPTTQEPWTDEAKELAKLDIKYGLIVEEVLEKRPELISYSHEYTNEDPYGPDGYFDMNSWKPTMWEDIDVIVLSVKAIQQLNDKIEALEARIQELEGL